MNETYINTITQDDCRNVFPELEDDSIDLLLSDIPYGIGLDDWDVLHNNTNSAFLGSSPAQQGKTGFNKRRKPINGWSNADRNIGKEYQQWCEEWASTAYKKLKPGASVFLFGARRTVHRVINALEDSGFLLKDVVAWKKQSAHHRAQRVSIVLERRGLLDDAKAWEGWRLGNLAPMWEPIAWFMKPYTLGGTITDNILEHGLGAMNIDGCKVNGKRPTNILEGALDRKEPRIHEAQKPVDLCEQLIGLTTYPGQLVIDPFAGSGTTAIAARNTDRRFIAIEADKEMCEQARTRLQKAAGEKPTRTGNEHQIKESGTLL